MSDAYYDPMKIGGKALEILPDALGMQATERRMCCSALECFGCIYVWDILGTLPTMRRIEKPENRYNTLYLPFYEAAWPCMCLAFRCGRDREELREVSAACACPWGASHLRDNIIWPGFYDTCIADND